MKYAKGMLALVMMILPVLAVGQLGSDTKIVAQVPFEFTAANKAVPAGQYTVRSAMQNVRAVAISNPAAKVNLFSASMADESKKAGDVYALVFHKYGDRYFLAGIKLAGTRVMYRLPMNRAEAELRAQNIPASDEMILAALQ